MEYYSAIKKNAFESVLMRWMRPEPIIQSEVSQKEKHQYSTAFTVSHRLWVVVFSFSFISMHILISFFISYVMCWLFRSVLFSLHMLTFLIVFFFPYSWHLILLHFDQKRCLRWFQFFLNFPRLDLWPRMWYILQKVPCALEKKVKFIVLGWNVL